MKKPKSKSQAAIAAARKGKLPYRIQRISKKLPAVLCVDEIDACSPKVGLALNRILNQPKQHSRAVLEKRIRTLSDELVRTRDERDGYRATLAVQYADLKYMQEQLGYDIEHIAVRLGYKKRK